MFENVKLSLFFLKMFCFPLSEDGWNSICDIENSICGIEDLFYAKDVYYSPDWRKHRVRRKAGQLLY